MANIEEGVSEMIPRKEKADAGTPAKKLLTTQQRISQTHPSHKYKIQIGEILLFLLSGNEQPDDWRLFEQFLGQLYDGGCLGN